MAHQTPDDAFREIQLNGKQLVFLFMVATVVSVVIFLCGVFVGRGVRAERASQVADNGSSAPVAAADLVPSQEPAPTTTGSDPTAAAPPPAVDELSYFSRLDKKTPAAENLTAAASKTPESKPAAVPAEPPKPAEKPAKPAEKAVARAATPAPPVSAAEKDAAKTPASDEQARSSEPSGPGFAIQVGALRERNEAETIARRLSSKGYAAYVVTPANGGPSVFRVRVGKFKTRREAESIATRLQKEEQFSPWITR